MSALWPLIYLSLFSGITALIGALLARIETLHPNWIKNEARHGIIALGGGALFAAISLVLLPVGMKAQPAWLSVTTFVMGAGMFMWLDMFLQKNKSPASQLIALLLDFVPEAIVLGAIITKDFRQAVFMAAIIALQNFPEGFNAYREIKHGHKNFLSRNTLLIIGVISVSGPILALGGMYAFDPTGLALGSLMTFCAGGIFYLVFNDIAPQAKMKKKWLPAFGAVIGFMIGMIGHALT